jgi:Spy/CpxP family protein refolding chaperone
MSRRSQARQATLPWSKIAFAGALAATLLLSPLAFAGPGKGKGKGKRIDKVCQKIECTDAQRKELRDVMREAHTDLESEREAMRELGAQLAEEYAKKNPNEKKMQQLYRKMDAHRANVRDRMHEAFMEIHPRLRPEQRQKLAELMARRGRH